MRLPPLVRSLAASDQRRCLDKGSIRSMRGIYEYGSGWFARCGAYSAGLANHTQCPNLRVRRRAFVHYASRARIPRIPRIPRILCFPCDSRALSMSSVLISPGGIVHHDLRSSHPTRG